MSVFDIPPKATSSLYVEGVPIDAREREVARIILSFFLMIFIDIFRPYPGFIDVRLIKKEAKNRR